MQQAPRDWTNATVTNTTDQPRSYIVRTDAGREYRRNSSQLHATQAKIERRSGVAPTFTHSNNESQRNENFSMPEESTTTAAPAPPNGTSMLPPADSIARSPPNGTSMLPPDDSTASHPVQQPRRSGRAVKKVVKMNL